MLRKLCINFLNPSEDDGHAISKQETSMKAQEGLSHDEFQMEVNRMRNSLNTLKLKQFMFHGDHSLANADDDEEIIVENKELVPITAPADEVTPFKRTLSKHRYDSRRTESRSIDQDDILKALRTSNENVISSERSVHFAGDVFPKKQPRDSDEVAIINNELPWQRKHEYRTVTPFIKPKNKTKAVNNEHLHTQPTVEFRPIETSRSTEDINKLIVKPVPIFASKSYQELPTTKWEFKSFDGFHTKSSDDLLLNNIDGIRKPESKTHKLMRIRSTSINSLDRSNEQIVYENFNYDTLEEPLSADSFSKKKTPLPLPRRLDDINDNKRSSLPKKLVYVLDKERDEFIPENPELNGISFDEVYEEVLLRNNIDQYSFRDSKLFNSLLTDSSREDCK